MQRLSAIATAFLLTGLSAAGASAQATHVVKLRADTAAGEYRVEPSVIVAHPKDIIVFQAVSGLPHNITFDEKGLSPQAHSALNAALPRRSADLSSPLLTAEGTEYRMVVPAIPPGTYKFFCLPHRAYDERGELKVE
jgi:plastocyanin